MIDLDPEIRRAQAVASVGWAEEDAILTTQRLADRLDLRTDYEPPDEEWIQFWNSDLGGMLSVRIPLAVVLAGVAPVLAEIDARVAVVQVGDFMADDLRASATLLRATVLPYGWDDDFDTEAFCANDLFVESV